MRGRQSHLLGRPVRPESPPGHQRVFLTGVDMAQDPAQSHHGEHHDPGPPSPPHRPELTKEQEAAMQEVGSSHEGGMGAAALSPGSQRQFTISCFGLAGGELGILSKRETIVPRPSTAPEPGSHPSVPSSPALPTSISSLADNYSGQAREPSNFFGAYYMLRRRPGADSARQRSSKDCATLAKMVQDQKTSAAKEVRLAALSRRATTGHPTTPTASPCTKDFPISSRPRHLSAGGFGGWKMVPGPKLTAGGFPGQKLSAFRPDTVQRPVLPLRTQSAPLASRGTSREGRDGQRGTAGTSSSRSMCQPRAGSGRRGSPSSPHRAAEMRTISEETLNASSRSPQQQQQQQQRQQRRPLSRDRPHTSPARPTGGTARSPSSPSGRQVQVQRTVQGTLFSLSLPEPHARSAAAAGAGHDHDASAATAEHLRCQSDREVSARVASTSSPSGHHAGAPRGLSLQLVSPLAHAVGTVLHNRVVRGSPSGGGAKSPTAALPHRRSRGDGEFVLQGSSAPRAAGKPAAEPGAQTEVGPWQTSGHGEGDGDAGLGAAAAAVVGAAESEQANAAEKTGSG